MADKIIDFEIRQRNKNNDGWIIQHPVTKAANVKFSDGTDVESHKADNSKQVPHLGTTTNSGDAYSITTTETIDVNQKFTIKFNTASTSAPTLKINTGTACAIKKANGNNAKLYASVYTLFWDGSAFILLGEGGEYGTALARDVRKTKTIGTDTGVIQGTLDLSNLIPTNLRKNIIVDGVVGTLVELPNTQPGDIELFKFAYTVVGSRSNPDTTLVLTKAKEARIDVAGTYRVKFKMAGAYNGGTVYGQIYVNGSPRGIKREFTRSSTVTSGTYTEDITVNAGDLIQLYFYGDDSVYLHESSICYSHNLYGSITYDLTNS